MALHPTNDCHGQLSGTLGDCLKKPTVVREGLGFCWQHDPERLDKLAADRHRERKEKEAQDDAAFEARQIRKRLERESGVDKLTDGDLKQIIEHGGIIRMLAVAETRREPKDRW